MSKQKEIPKSIRRYFLLLGTSFGLCIGVIFIFLPLIEALILWLFSVFFVVAYYTIIQIRNKDIFEEYGIIKKREK